jgi:3-hydroxybutyryl-CoA dehydrogenase
MPTGRKHAYMEGNRPVATVGVVGAGTMGAGIAQIAALGGYETFIHDADPTAVEAGRERLAGALAKGAERGRWSKADAAAADARIETAPAPADLAGCDLVIEAAPELLDLKRTLFAELAGICGPEAVLASNTSSLRIGDIAVSVPGPERVVGMHFFNPPPLMKLVEIVAAEGSSEEALAAATEVGERMGRTPIRAKDSPGFVANRLARPFTLESLRMLGDEIADAATIDRAVRAEGFRMGPFELLDLIGLDVNLTIARSFFAQGGEPERWRPNPIQERLVEEGRLGRKSGEGYYSYPRGEMDEDGLPEPPAEIVPRLYAQIANEAAFALEEGVASPADMDTAMRLGFNWPRGPIEIATGLGAKRAVELLDGLRAARGEAYEAAPQLRAEAER